VRLPGLLGRAQARRALARVHHLACARGPARRSARAQAGPPPQRPAPETERPGL